MGVINLPVHSYKLRSPPASCARLVNCYAEPLPAGAKTPVMLTRVAGVDDFAEVGNGPIRGMHSAFGNPYAVTGSEVRILYANGGSGILGSVGSGAIDMAHNINKLVIVSAPNAYYSDGTTLLNLPQISDPDFTALGARWVDFVNNYMVFVSADGKRFFWADVGTATDFNALNFATPEGLPDDIVGMAADHGQLIQFGSESVELFNTTANGFERAINGYIELGCLNGETIAKFDNSVGWLASDFTVRRLEGTTPVKISTYAVDQFLTTVDVTTGRAYSYSQDGHIFYVLCFSTGCMAYDATTGEWAERQSHPEDFYRWQHTAVAHGKIYVGDAYSNRVGMFDPTVYTEYDFVQRMEFTTQAVYAENRLAFHHRLEVVLETGVGITTGQGSDPEIMASYSDDGGLTWNNLPNRKLGAIGERFVRVHWDGLGSSRQRVYRFAVSDPVRITVTQVVLTATGARI